MKKQNWIIGIVISLWLTAAYYNAAARESVHYFLWAINLSALLVLFALEEEREKIKRRGFSPDILFDVLFAVASIFYGWPVLAAVQAFVIALALSLMFNKETSK